MLEAEGDRLRRVRAAQGSDQDGRDEDKNESQGGIVADNEQIMSPRRSRNSIVADNEPEEKQEEEGAKMPVLDEKPQDFD